MLNPSIVDTDPDKLTSLYMLSILNIQREERFDCITREAAHLFDAPIAILSLASEYQRWFKALFGVDVPLPNPGTKTSAFCKPTNMTSLVVPDTLRDPAFANNPMVLDAPFVRFYVGQALMSEPEQVAEENARYSRQIKLGTLCVINQTPYWPTSQQLAALEELAKRASHELVKHTK